MVGTGEDHHALKATAKEYNITHPCIVIVNYDDKLIEEAMEVPGWENIPVPVMNTLMEYGSNYIVSN